MDPDAGSTGSVQTLDPIKDAEPEIPSGGLVAASIGPCAAIVVALRSAVRGLPSVSFAGFLARHGRLTCAPIAGIGLLALAFATRYVHHVISDPAALGVWWIGNAALLFLVYTFFKNGRVRPQPTAAGRVVAIVPAHEQDDDDLHACIWSILNQRGAVVKEVHVVDDGSTQQPVQPFSHPRVRWHRTTYGGGHAAAGYVLDRLRPEDWDFVLIVDGTCVLAERSMERQLRAFSRTRVVATTGLVISRDPRRNLLSRISDLNIGALSALSMAGWSPVCLLQTVSGTPVLYRAAIPFQHRRHLLAEGGYDDSRRLARYAALEGAVVGVSNAVAWTASAAHVPTAYRRRLGWSTSWWRLIRLALTGADWRRGLRCRLFGLAHLIVVPLAIGYALISLATSGWHGVPQATIFLYAALFLLLRYAATALYLIEDPATSRGRKVLTWLLLTPAEASYHLVVVIPIRYIALIRLCGRGRKKWPDRTAVPAEPLTTAPGAVYYSGYLPDGHGS